MDRGHSQSKSWITRLQELLGLLAGYSDPGLSPGTAPHCQKLPVLASLASNVNTPPSPPPCPSFPPTPEARMYMVGLVPSLSGLDVSALHFQAQFPTLTLRRPDAKGCSFWTVGPRTNSRRTSRYIRHSAKASRHIVSEIARWPLLVQVTHPRHLTECRVL